MFLYPHIVEARPVLGKVFKKRILGHFESFGRVGCLVLHTAVYINRIIPLRWKVWIQMELSDGLLQDFR